jgi:hypothetical protein
MRRRCVTNTAPAKTAIATFVVIIASASESDSLDDDAPHNIVHPCAENVSRVNSLVYRWWIPRGDVACPRPQGFRVLSLGHAAKDCHNIQNWRVSFLRSFPPFLNIVALL